MAKPTKTFQLLEINVISAQDLEPVAKKMKTYATAWMNPKRKLSSCVDSDGHTNPTWNDKFVFRVEEEFLRRDTSSVMIEIYAGHWFKDVLIGSVRVLVGNLVPPPDIRTQHNGYIGMRFVALQVRRPSGRPQGILNLGVAVLDPSMRSMPLYTQPAMSAVGYRDLMDGPPPHHLQHNENDNDNHNNYSQPPAPKPILRRSRSERSELMGLDNFSPSSSMIIVKSKPKAKESSILSITECMVPLEPITKRKAGKASSVINGAELHERPRQRGKKSKASSVVSDSMVSKDTTAFQRIATKNLNGKEEKTEEKPLTLDKSGCEEVNVKAIIKAVEDKQVAKTNAVNNISPPKEKLTIGKPITKYNGYDYGGPRAQGKYGIGAPFKKGTSILSDSEVGPSPSEVAAAMMMAERRYPLEQDNQSSMLDGWSMDESVEGLRSKLERWRMELPPLYDRGGYSTSSYKTSSSQRTRRNTSNNESGLFSCFGNIFGYECQCVCGKPKGRKGAGRFNSPSTTPGRSFI